MKEKMINICTIEGKIYQHKLAIKQVQNKDSANFGKDFIGGTLDIATDDDNLNIVTVYYTYVAPTFSTGKENSTFSALKRIIKTGKTVLEDGNDNATKVRLTPSVDVNEFYSTDRGTGEERLVTAKRCSGGFVNFIDKLNPDVSTRSKFDTDMVIMNVKHVDADPEKNIAEDYTVLEGYIFNFRKEIFKVQYTVHDKKGMKYFESLGVTPKEPVFTKVWGNIISKTQKTKQIIEGAFGEEVKEYEHTFKEFEVLNANPNPYEFSEDSAILSFAELKSAMQDMETRQAEVKRRQDEYQAQKAANGSATAATSAAAPAKSGGFNFDSF